MPVGEEGGEVGWGRWGYAGIMVGKSLAGVPGKAGKTLLFQCTGT